MITFLRRIRQRLITENKFSKYLLYAIGEIVLVVIGILLALQINNWNEERNQRKLEQSILLEMKENLLFDLADIRGNITRDSTHIQATAEVLNSLENKTIFNDSLKRAYGKLGLSSLFEENTSAFENLKSLGFNLISNDNLRRKITFLYSARYEYVNVIYTGHNDFVFNRFRPIMNQHTTSQTDNYYLRKPNNPSDLSENKPFMELLREDLWIKGFNVNLTKRLEKDVLELISLIEKEINHD